DAYLLPVSIQFLGQQGGKASVGALPHFEMFGHHRNRIVRGDAYEGVRREVHRLRRLLVAAAQRRPGSLGWCHARVDRERQTSDSFQEPAAAFVDDEDVTPGITH